MPKFPALFPFHFMGDSISRKATGLSSVSYQLRYDKLKNAAAFGLIPDGLLKNSVLLRYYLLMRCGILLFGSDDPESFCCLWF